MSIFICTKSDCVNKDIVYNFGDDAPAFAECGGCKTKLWPQA